MMTLEDMRITIGECKYPGFFIVVYPNGAEPYLQISFEAPCNEGGDHQIWKSRKWKLSYHMTTTELVRTTYKAVLAAVEHEVQEKFKYSGRAIYGPHVDVEALWDIADQKDVRPAQFGRE